ncbi:MAG: hypothetical protein AAGE85_09630 [Pseudomonadota bacterium]
MKVLQIINTAYRATIEEQDDTVVWLTHAMTGAGGDFDVLLAGNAVNYTVERQDAAGLSFGDWRQTQPPRLGHDVAGLIGKHVRVYVVDEDVREIGLTAVTQVDGFTRIARAELADLFDQYDQIWRW